MGIIRYEAGVLDWTNEELKSIDIKTRKLMTMNGSLHPRGNVGRFYLARKQGGREFISCEGCVNVEVKSLDKCLRESEEWLFKFVAEEKGLSEVDDQYTFKKYSKKKKTSRWLEKPSHGRFLKDSEKMSIERMWQWLKGGHLKKEIEAMVCAT